MSAVIFSNSAQASKQFKDVTTYHVYATPIITEKAQEIFVMFNEFLWVEPAALSSQAAILVKTNFVLDVPIIFTGTELPKLCLLLPAT